MISFKILTEQSKDLLLDEMEQVIPGGNFELAEMNLDIMIDNVDEDMEYAVSFAHGCLLVRVFDGEYSFMYPLALHFNADSALAAEEIRAYAIKEEIPLVYTEVPKENLGELLPLFRHANIDAEDEEGRFYTVRVMSEAYLLGEMPVCEGNNGVSLTPLTPRDDEIYSRLCKDEDTNRYWGYDYSCDEPDPEDSYFRESAEGEFDRGVAMCMAIRVNDVFAGEAILYGFDLKGGCECAVRLLPAFRRKGYAVESLNTLKRLAARMGLVYLCATVAKENAASIHMTGKCLAETGSDDKTVKYKEYL